MGCYSADEAETLGDASSHSTAKCYPGKMGKYFMISLLNRSGLHTTSRALGIAQALQMARGIVLLGLMGLLAACGGGGGGGSGGGGGGSTSPPAVTLSSITVAPTGTGGATVVAGLTLQFSATGAYSDGTQKDLTSTVTWTSSDPTKAMINSATGLVTGLVAGPSTITATFTSATAGSKDGNVVLTVAPPNLLSVVISPNNPSVPVGKDLQFYAIGSYTDGKPRDLTTSVVWSSDTKATATIDSATGAAKALVLGSTHISATMTGGPAISSVPMTVTATVYAYATNFDDNTVSMYELNPDGSGSLIAQSPATVAAGTNPFSISVEPTGEYVYVSNWGSNNVSQYKIEADGKLTALPTATVATGKNPNAVTINHHDQYAYVANFADNTVSQYTIGLDGLLVPMSAPAVASGTAPASLIVAPNDKYAYVGNFGADLQNPPSGPGTISQYSVGSDGSLTPMSSATAVSGSGPNALAIDPASKYLYVANFGDNTVGQYTINSDGSLTAMPLPAVNTGGTPVGIAIDPTGSYVYIANRADGTISQYTVDTTAGSPTAGSLTPMLTPAVQAGTSVSGVTIDPTGQFLYATNRGDTTVSQFKIGAGGALVAMTATTVVAGLHPTAIATGY